MDFNLEFYENIEDDVFNQVCQLLLVANKPKNKERQQTDARHKTEHLLFDIPLSLQCDT